MGLVRLECHLMLLNRKLVLGGAEVHILLQTVGNGTRDILLIDITEAWNSGCTATVVLVHQCGQQALDLDNS